MVSDVTIREASSDARFELMNLYAVQTTLGKHVTVHRVVGHANGEVEEVEK